ncbi:hypothetical protein [Methylovulum psychrotolerans]|jgi:hypothetical protein|uniref:hypothetical protein n=1 Tax=Methylovulum psychrotolerans TaxID=1704499 RepID=UPI0014765A93|nr:hypothetical protein [Methylovulum psychrotolerans]MBT9098017.1 hypothetical protein [Methylovulum psychrotolerans]
MAKEKLGKIHLIIPKNITDININGRYSIVKALADILLVKTKLTRQFKKTIS